LRILRIDREADLSVVADRDLALACVRDVGSCRVQDHHRWTDRARECLRRSIAEFGDGGLGPSHARDRHILARFGSLLAESDISIPETVAGMAAFRLLRRWPHIEAPDIGAASHVLHAAVFDRVKLDPVIREVIARFEGASGDGGLKEDLVARDFYVSPAHLGRMLQLQTRLRWREWKLGRRFRVVLRDLRSSAAPLKAIAFEHQWNTYGQFCHDFHARLGMTAGEFRSAARACPKERKVLFTSLQVDTIRSSALVDTAHATFPPDACF
jgi:AraC-like DNA-binding protein